MFDCKECAGTGVLDKDVCEYCFGTTILKCACGEDATHENIAACDVCFDEAAIESWNDMVRGK